MKQRRLTLGLPPETLAVSRLEAKAQGPVWAESGPVVSITRAHVELCIVCEDAAVPSHVMCQRGLRCLRVLGPLDFAETGVLESMAEPLARAGISIFALSTYDTDYLLLPEGKLNAAVSALSEAGHAVRRRVSS